LTGQRGAAKVAAMADADPNELLERAKARVGDVVPEADLSAFAVAFSIVRASERITLELERLHKPMGWTWPGFRMLFWLWMLGPLEPRRLAEAANASRASVSSALNTLERSGFVHRRHAQADRRLVTVELTEQGRARLADAYAAANASERELVAPLSAEERDTLVSLLNRLLAQP
jgi:DNA-binding MarR family transcriptional regulator